MALAVAIRKKLSPVEERPPPYRLLAEITGQYSKRGSFETFQLRDPAGPPDSAIPRACFLTLCYCNKYLDKEAPYA
jgi:hypothetical protein